MKKKTSKLSWFGTGAFAIIGVVIYHADPDRADQLI